MNIRIMIVILAFSTLPLMAMEAFLGRNRNQIRADRPLDEQLFDAAGSGNIPLAKRLIAAGAKVNSVTDRDGHGNCITPLQTAAMGGQTQMVKFLIRRGAYVWQRDKHQQTPLMWAAFRHRLDVVKVLLAAVPAGGNERIRLDNEKRRVLATFSVFSQYLGAGHADIKYRIVNDTINELVDSHMRALQTAVNIQSTQRPPKTALTIVPGPDTPTSLRMKEYLALRDPATVEEIRRDVKNNILLYIFGNPNAE